jgi:hypothetical protein
VSLSSLSETLVESKGIHVSGGHAPLPARFRPARPDSAAIKDSKLPA